MRKIRVGDVVGRISYGKDIFFVVDRILNLDKNKKIAILKGITIRIKADSDIDDLVLIDINRVRNTIASIDKEMSNRFQKLSGMQTENSRKNYKYGTILHLDGDSRYTQKSAKYYKKMGIDAVVKNVLESRQPIVIRNLLQKYKPDILVVTGHDGMIKNGTGYNDIYNYRNSAYFVKSVKIAREWEGHSNNLSIFARCMPELL